MAFLNGQSRQSTVDTSRANLSRSGIGLILIEVYFVSPEFSTFDLNTLRDSPLPEVHNPLSKESPWPRRSIEVKQCFMLREMTNTPNRLQRISRGMPIMRKDLDVSSASADAAAELTMASASATVTHALHAGAQAPSFVLPDKNGNNVTLDQLLCSGPVVLNFLRGSWCSFGEESLAQFSSMHERIRSAGAMAVAIAPPDLSKRQDGQLPIPELVDTDLLLAREFGLTFDLPEDLRGRYLDLGYIPPMAQKSGDFLVPVPATYLIDGDGIVVFAHIDFDYRNGFDSESLLRAVRALRTRREARSHDGEGSPMSKSVRKFT